MKRETVSISGILVNFWNVEPPPHKRKASPQNRKTPYGKFSGDSSDMNVPIIRMFLHNDMPEANLHVSEMKFCFMKVLLKQCCGRLLLFTVVGVMRTCVHWRSQDFVEGEAEPIEKNVATQSCLSTLRVSHRSTSLLFR